MHPTKINLLIDAKYWLAQLRMIPSQSRAKLSHVFVYIFEDGGKVRTKSVRCCMRCCSCCGPLFAPNAPSTTFSHNSPVSPAVVFHKL